MSPAELLMGRRLQTKLPQVTEHLKPPWSYIPNFRKEDEEFKRKQKMYFDRHRRVRDLHKIVEGQEVWITSGPTPIRKTVVSSSTQPPRSYQVETNTGSLRRNRVHLNPVPEHSTSPEQSTSLNAEHHKIMTRTQMRTAIHPPTRFQDYSA